MAPPPSPLTFWPVALPLLFAALPTLGWLLGWPSLAWVVGALLVPVLEGLWVLQHRAGGLRQAAALHQWGPWWPRLVALIVLVQALVLTAWAAPQASGLTLLWLGLSLGYVAGGTGIVLGHELGHRRSRLDKGLSLALLTQVGFGHYQLAHNRGHHRAAATWPDSATARRNESLPRFLLRYYPGVWRSACELARAHRLRWWGLPPAQTSLALFVGVSLGWLLAVGPEALAVWLVQAAVAQYLVGAIDYVAHWGLQRAVRHGQPERMGPQHIWDCRNPVSELLLFNLPRHAHHHLQPWHGADQLQATPASPQMPTGYAGMVWLAALPPLFERVMAPRLPAQPPAP